MGTRQTQLFTNVRPEWDHIDGIRELDRDPTEGEIKWGITTEELDRRHYESPEPTRENERRCQHCGRRVTETESGYEAGHAAGWREPQCHFHATAEARDKLLSDT